MLDLRDLELAARLLHRPEPKTLGEQDYREESKDMQRKIGRSAKKKTKTCTSSNNSINLEIPNKKTQQIITEKPIKMTVLN